MSAAPFSVETKVLVTGAGAMGAGIAQVAATAGHTVYLYDTRAEAVEKGRAGVAKDLQGAVAKGRMSQEQAEAVLERIVAVSSIDAAADAGLVVEAIIEDLPIKQTLFRELETKLSADAVLTSNTSSISITAIAAALQRPERVAGLHFFNPAPRMALVEVVSGLATDPAIAARLFATAAAWRKVPVHAKSTPGFIVNRVARPYYAEALRVLQEQAADVATLDALMREACGFPMGPFELMDLIGHDVNFAVTSSVHAAYFADQRFTPNLIQQELVRAGRLGRKSGQGFYDYRPEAQKPAPQTAAALSFAGKISVTGNLGVAAPLVARFQAAGIAVSQMPDSDSVGEIRIESGELLVDDIRLVLCDGRTATRRAYEDGLANLVVFDLARDYAEAGRIAVAKADQCSTSALSKAVALFQAAGFAVSVLDDVAGLIAMRTVCMLANEAADGLNQGIGSARDIDVAMEKGTNYPRGPLAWADAIGLGHVHRVLQNLQNHYGEDRYRVSPLIQRKAMGGGKFHDQ